MRVNTHNATPPDRQRHLCVCVCVCWVFANDIHDCNNKMERERKSSSQREPTSSGRFEFLLFWFLIFLVVCLSISYIVLASVRTTEKYRNTATAVNATRQRENVLDLYYYRKACTSPTPCDYGITVQGQPEVGGTVAYDGATFVPASLPKATVDLADVNGSAPIDGCVCVAHPLSPTGQIWGGAKLENSESLGQPNGVASVCETGYICDGQLPAMSNLANVFKFSELWNASSNTPRLNASSCASGSWYIVSHPGTTNLTGPYSINAIHTEGSNNGTVPSSAADLSSWRPGVHIRVCVQVQHECGHRQLYLLVHGRHVAQRHVCPHMVQTGEPVHGTQAQTIQEILGHGQRSASVLLRLCPGASVGHGTGVVDMG